MLHVCRLSARFLSVLFPKSSKQCLSCVAEFGFISNPLLCLVSLPCYKFSIFFFFTWQKVTEEKYEIKVAYEEAAIKIVTTTDPKVVVTITLTSPVMREGEESEHGRCFFVLFLQPQGP